MQRYRGQFLTLLDRGAALAAVAMSGFAIYVAAFGVFDNIIVSGFTVLLALVYGFLAWRQPGEMPTPLWLLGVHAVMAVVMVALLVDWAMQR